MIYVYVLRSLKDHRLYIGFAGNLAKRLKKHGAGGVPATKHRRPLEMVYHETCKTRLEARLREKFLKSGPGHVYLKQVLEQRDEGSGFQQ